MRKEKALGYSMMGLGALMAVSSAVGAVHVYRETINHWNEAAVIGQKIEEVKQDRATAGINLEKCLTSATSSDCNLLSFKYESLKNKYSELQVDLSEARRYGDNGYLLLGLSVFTIFGGFMAAENYTYVRMLGHSREEKERNQSKSKGEQ